MADDEDMGTSFMRQHMSEAALSKEDGSFARRNASNRFRPIPDTDSGIEQKYGKAMDFNASQEVNTDTKGDKGSGAIGSSEWTKNKNAAYRKGAMDSAKAQSKK